jgi:hypothetical protein
MITRLLALALVAPLAAGIPTSAFANATLQSFELCVSVLESCNSPGLSGGPSPNVSVNITGSYQVGGSAGPTFTIGPSGAGVTPTVFGIDSTLDKIGLTNSLITYTGTGPVTLTIDYSFLFTPPTPTTFGVQMAGAFKRGTGTAAATGDSVSATSTITLLNSAGGLVATKALNTPLFTVGTNGPNTFAPPKTPSGQAPITCTPGVVCTSDLLETVVTLHFEQPGDSLLVPNSFITVSCADDPESCAISVQAALDAEAAADRDALGIPEPDTVSLLLGSGLAGLGLSRLKQLRGRARQDRRDEATEFPARRRSRPRLVRPFRR